MTISDANENLRVMLANAADKANAFWDDLFGQTGKPKENSAKLAAIKGDKKEKVKLMPINKPQTPPDDYGDSYIAHMAISAPRRREDIETVIIEYLCEPGCAFCVNLENVEPQKGFDKLAMQQRYFDMLAGAALAVDVDIHPVSKLDDLPIYMFVPAALRFESEIMVDKLQHGGYSLKEVAFR
jgi:FtsZ-interacting cell division protein YlmF